MIGGKLMEKPGHLWGEGRKARIGRELVLHVFGSERHTKMQQ